MESNGKLTNRKLLEETHDTMTQLKTVLLGVPGTDDKGLVGDVKEVKVVQREQGKSIGKIKKNFWLLVGTLVGSGVLGSVIYG